MSFAARRVLQRRGHGGRCGHRSFSTRSYDAIIIGAGVIGNSIATELSRSGWCTLNIDKLRGSGQGSTGYSSGICRMMYSLLDSVKFAWEGYDYFEKWEEHIGVKEPPGGLARLRRCGALVLRSPQSQVFLERVVASHEAVGLPFEFWSAEEIQKRLAFDLQSYGPQVRIDDDSFGEATGPALTGGVHFPLTGYVSDPMLAACNLQAAAEATGRAEFLFGQSVSEILRRNGGVGGVRLTSGAELEAPVVVNVAGPHSSQITAMALDSVSNDMTISTRAMRQEVAYVSSPPEVSWDDGGEGLVCTDMDAGVYFRPEVGGKILVGGVEPSCDQDFHIYPSDPEAVYPGGELASLTDQWTNQVYRLALRIPTLPLPEAGNAQGCAACYDVTEDWVPIYDKSALPGFYMAIGTSGNQFKNAGVAGRLMSEIIQANESGIDTDAEPLEFQLKRIPCGGSISSSTFSRKRSILQTSGSVLG